MDRMALFRSGVTAEAALTVITSVGSAVFQSLNEYGKINLFLAIDYVVCSADGVASRGLIHMAAAALDLVKSGIQMSVFMLIKSSRVSILALPDPVNWNLAIDKSTRRSTRASPLIQSLAKRPKGPKIGADTATSLRYKALGSWKYLSGSASAEVTAVVAPCPFEAVKFDDMKAVA
ncbi:hypothetical protein ZIOFF_026515 [Zingiber officinale]|uniref:Uncharacterized protein n=1 Tax=Zingiber officinale TaxID=94328 RepID=A0A8J5GY07_ZINOF|nr:hypothetical protein ZIOFF_026515 [Zingiber officinale]